MTFLSWQSAALTAVIAVPLLVLLYFLKLRRQERRVTSTLLWKKAIQDLQVNAPFQKLRRNLLLLLQLLVLAAIIFGLANPVVHYLRTPERNIVILLDCSASMRTVEADGRPRLAQAQDAAVAFVANLPDASRAMVITFADRANVACSFTNDKRRLQRAIDGAEATDGPSRIGEALELAQAHMSHLVDVPNVSVPEAGRQAADIEVFSDGRLSDADQPVTTRGGVRYYRAGEASDNVGITAFDVQRDPERPGMVCVFAQVQNFGPRPVTTDVSLYLDGRPAAGRGAVREVTLGPADAARGTEAAAAGQNVLFEFEHAAGGVIEVRVHRADSLAGDNVVMAPIDPPRPLRVLVVTDRGPVRRFLTRVLASLEVEEVVVKGGREYEEAPEADLLVEGRSAFDLVIFDGHDTARLPPGNYLFYDGLPKVEGVGRREEIRSRPLVWANEDHPLMRGVSFEAIFVARWHRLELPGHATPLLSGEDSTVVAYIGDPGHRYVVAAFDLLDSDFPLKESFPIFHQNVLRYLASGGLVEARTLLRPGESLTASVPAGVTRAVVTRPDGSSESIDVGGKTSLTYARTDRAGLYRVRFDDAEATTALFAVNILDANESAVAPNEHLTLGSEKVAAVGGDVRVNAPLWPYAAAVGLAFVMLEWWVYNRRVMI